MREDNAGSDGLFWGRNSVLELLSSGRAVDKIYVQKGSREGRLKVKFPDKTGWALKIKKVDQSYIYTEQHPAFDVTDTGSKMLFFPRIEFEAEGYTRITPADMLGYTLKDLRNQKPRGYESDTWIEVDIPTFVQN